MSTDSRKRTFLRFAAGALGAATLAACGRKDEPAPAAALSDTAAQAATPAATAG